MNIEEKYKVRIPSIEEPYTYLKAILYDQSNNIKQIGMQASALLSKYTANLTNTTTINNNLTFLKNVADHQRQQETAFLKAKIQQLKELGNGTLQDKLCQFLEQGIDNFDYITFIQLLNEAMSSITAFRGRLQAIKNADGGLYREEQLLDNLDTTLFADLSDERRNLRISQNELIRQLTLKFIKDHGQDLLQNNPNPLQIAAAAVIIQQQLVRYLQDSKKIQKHEEGFYTKVENFKQEYNTLLEELDNFYNKTNISTIFTDTTILDEAINIFGLKLDNNKTNIAHKSYKIESLKKELNNDPFLDLPDLKQAMSQVQVNWRGKNKSSSLEEIILLLTTKALQLGQLNSATDTIGAFEILTPDAQEIYGNDTNSPSFNTLKDIRATLIAEKAANDPKKTSAIYQQKLNELDKSLTNIGKSFIIHDTVKLYKTIESDKQSTFASFTGRTMSIFNFIDSLVEMGYNFGVDTDWMKFAAYNLSGDALGDFNKAPLETTFTIAAGLIMFDDFAIVAKELIDNLQFANIDNIHLYQIQGLYIPSSFVLTETYNRMSYALDHYGPPKDNGISATISAPSIKFVDNNDSTLLDWENIKKQARNTKVVLHFMANFLNLVSNLLQ